MTGARAQHADHHVDLGGRAVVPAFVDSHTHLVFAGDRERRVRRPDERARPTTEAGSPPPWRRPGRPTTTRLRDPAGRRGSRRCGPRAPASSRSSRATASTSTSETRLLRLAREVTDEVTFLGGHVVPPEFRSRRGDYVEMVTGPMLAAAAAYARWVDVFCEPQSPHAFDGDESRTILQAGRAAGTGPAGARQPARAGPGRPASPSSSGRRASTTAPTSGDADVDGTRRAAPRWPRCCPVSSSPRAQPYPDARALVDAGVTRRAGHRLQPGHLLHIVDALRHRPGRARAASHPCRRPYGRRPAVRHNRSHATTSDRSSSVTEEA